MMAVVVVAAIIVIAFEIHRNFKDINKPKGI